ncbi:MAG: outer membrane protein transport protein [Deltaproteobacteria bacterium]|nr:outer membrane protein transport protein [Deltaproteobacteria bacterium]
MTTSKTLQYINEAHRITQSNGATEKPIIHSKSESQKRFSKLIIPEFFSVAPLLRVSNYLFGFIFCFTVLLSPVRESAAQVEISSSLNPVGSGARALGMGGAFIGVADDATAASWNPAGLVQLEKPEISLVYDKFFRNQSYESSSHPEMAGNNGMDADGINYASLVYPFQLFDRNMVVSLNYQKLYDMDKKVNFAFKRDMGIGILSESISFTQSGSLHTFSPALAVQVTPWLYVGGTLNIWGDFLHKNGWQNNYRSTGTGILGGDPVTTKVEWDNNSSLKGVNGNLGLMGIYGPFMFGFVYKLPFDADLRKETTFTQSWDWPGVAFDTTSTTRTVQNMTLSMPASYGLGVSYRHSDSWMVALDLYRTEWSDYTLRDAAGNVMNPVTNAPIADGHLKDTIQVRLGTEYLFIRDKFVIPLRFGLFYDPEPQTKTVDDYFGFSFGSGITWGPVSADLAYQYRFGNDVTGDVPLPGVKSSIDQHTLMMSVVYRF